MKKGQASYHHDLGGELYLDAYAIDPSLTESALMGTIEGNKRTEELDLSVIEENTIFKERVASFDEFDVEVSDRKYKVPEQLQDYRTAVGDRNDAMGWFNGPVAIVDGPVQNPLRVLPGGFYDFVATKLEEVPSKLALEYEVLSKLPRDSVFWRLFPEGFSERVDGLAEKLRGKYPEKATVEELFKQWGVDNSRRGRYLGIAYLLSTNSGAELSLVQRAKGMAVAADCMSSPGSTPNPPFDEPGFNFKNYFKGHVADEMREEYKIDAEEFEIGSIYLFDDKRQMPFMAVEVKTPLSTCDLAERIYGNEESIKEHTILYSFSPHAIDRVVDQLDVFPAISHVLRVCNENR